MNVDNISKMIENSREEHIIVGVAGGSCSGKTTLVKILQHKINGCIIPMDDYYKDVDPIGEKIDHNFDEPAAQDLELLAEHLRALKTGNKIQKPVYDFRIHGRRGSETIAPARVILVDGLFALHESLKDMMDIKIFVDCEEKERLERRLARDIKERGRTRESVLYQYHKTVRPMHLKHVEPTKRHADIVISNSRDF